MKKPIYILIIIVIILAGTYAANRYFGDGAQSEGTNVAEDEYVTHTSKEFSFEYPKNWFVNDVQSENNSYVQITNYDPNNFVQSPYAQGKYFGYEIYKDLTETQLSLEEWVEEYIARQEYETSVIEKKEIILDGNKGIYQIENIIPREIIHPAIYFKKGKNIYLVNISPLTPELESVHQKFIESFRFLDIQ